MHEQTPLRRGLSFPGNDRKRFMKVIYGSFECLQQFCLRQQRARGLQPALPRCQRAQDRQLVSSTDTTSTDSTQVDATGPVPSSILVNTETETVTETAP